jgi:hypothetical protein
MAGHKPSIGSVLADQLHWSEVAWRNATLQAQISQQMGHHFGVHSKHFSNMNSLIHARDMGGNFMPTVTQFNKTISDICLG